MDDQKLEAFNAVTGNQSREAAEFFIEASGGSVEKAINAFLESGGAVPDGIGSAPDAAAPATSTPADKPKMTVASAKDDEEQRWYTGGPQGGSGQEVIAPGQGGTGNMATDLMEQMKPHAHDPSEDDRKSAAFKGSARTLDGQVKKAEEAPKVVEIKMYADEVFTVDDGPPRGMHDNAAFFEAIRRQELPPELQPEGGGTVQLSLHHVPREYDASTDAPKRTFQGTSRRLNEGASTSGAPPAQVQQPLTSWNGPDESKPVTSIQIRMPDGSRLVGRFNLDQKVHEIRSFVAAARPADKNRSYQMLAGFPQKPVPDENVTIEEGGLKGSVVVFK